MISTLQLIQNQKTSAILFTIGSVLLVITSSEEITMEIKKFKGIEIKPVPSPAQVTAFSFWLLSGGGLIAALTATIRLAQLTSKLPSANNRDFLSPDLLIFTGSWLLFAGLFALALGSQQKAQEEQGIVIF